MINQAARVDTAQGPVFVKWNADALPGLFSAEADGLQRLREAAALRVPTVLAVHDREPEVDALPFLALEYLEPHSPSDPRRFAREFGETLAAQHLNAEAPTGRFGLERDNYLGSLPQINTPTDDWPTFYRDRRLVPQMEIARRLGRLPANRERLLRNLLEKVDGLLEGVNSRPVLLHGDLWSGNFHCADDAPVVIDPAVYYGDREVEIAYVELFGGFPAGFHEAYRAAAPMAADYERRRPLYQLYPLLVHLNHFGEPYDADVENVCLHYRD